MLEKYFKILGVEQNADEKEVKKAYRKLAMKYHPDVSKDQLATEKFHKICEAYEIVLSHIHRETVISTEESEEDSFDPRVYEEIIREAREKANRRAKMKYEKIKAEKEFFQNNDFIVFFKYIGNYLAVPLGFGLIVIPIYLAITESYVVFFATIFFWVVGFILLSHIYSKRKTWFHPGEISTGWNDVINFFKVPRKKDAGQNCRYSPGKKANSEPFKLTMFRVRDIRMENLGVFHHRVGYSRKYKEIIIPRSIKAYRIHFIMAFIKPLIFLASILFLPVASFVWKVAGAILLTLAASNLVYLVFNTRSKTSYLLNSFQLIKVAVWLFVIISQTTYYKGFVFFTEPLLGLYLLLLLFFLDMFLDLILRIFPYYHRLYIPITKQPEVVLKFFRSGFQNYLDTPIWSTLYPFFRWLF